jgi:hypothetical protein
VGFMRRPSRCDQKPDEAPRPTLKPARTEAFRLAADLAFQEWAESAKFKPDLRVLHIRQRSEGGTKEVNGCATAVTLCDAIGP